MQRTTVLSIVLLLGLGGCRSAAHAPASDALSKESASKEEGGDLDEKRHDVQAAELELAIARLEAQADESAAQVALDAARLEHHLATAALAHFVEVEQTLELQEQRLALQRSRQRTVESEQELAELEAMYAQEQFAETTKELVLMRGRTQLEQAKQSQQLAEQRAAEQESYTLPLQRQELAQKVEKTEVALRNAEQAIERGTLERQLKLLKAERALTSKRQALEKAD